MSATHRPLFAALLVALVALQFQSVLSSDPCQLLPQNQTVWYGAPSRAIQCFNAIPFSESVRRSTMEIMQRVFALYSFSDIAQAGLQPFLLNVDWPGMLRHINTTTYQNDYEFHSALAVGMASLLDAHAVYYVPSGYRLFATIRPFSLTSKLVNGTQQYFAAPSRISPTTYSQLCQCQDDLELFYGRRILYIDTIPVEDYLTTMASQCGFYLDPGAQLNTLLGASSAFAFQATAFIALPSDTINIVFEGDLVGYTFNNYMTTSRVVNSTQDIINLNMPSPKRDENGRLSVDTLNVEEQAVLDLIREQLSNDKLSVKQREISERNANALETAIRLSSLNANEEELKIAKSYAPSLRHQQLVDAWGTFLAFENGVPDWDPAGVPGEQVRDVAEFTVESEVAPVAEGNPDLLVSYEETTALSYWSYDETTVLRLKSFFPPTAKDRTAFLNMVKTAAHSRGTNGLNKNLILDVSGNGGGYVCLSYFLLSYLVRPWNKASLTGNDILFNPYDIRQSSYTDDIFNHGYWGQAQEEVSETTREPLGTAFYTDHVSRTYGLSTSNYTQKFLWNLCDADNYQLSPKSLVFDKILVITDGRCGSACSYFLSKLRTSNKVRVMSYGGHWGKPMDTSAFSGGNVHGWSDWVTELKEHMPSLSWLNMLPTTAITTFNFREMYNPGDEVPRQFIRMPADFILPFWDPLRGNTDLSVASQKAALASLYASAVPMFEKMPSGLLGTNKSEGLIVALSIIGIIIGTTIIATVVICIIVRRRNGSPSDEYGEISSPDY